MDREASCGAARPVAVCASPAFQVQVAGLRTQKGLSEGIKEVVPDGSGHNANLTTVPDESAHQVCLPEGSIAQVRQRKQANE